MSKVEENSDGLREKSKISKPMNDFPKDLLCRFNSIDHLHVKFEEQSNDANAEEEEEEEEEELELTLGLSLNGRFGIDPREKKKIKRASSIPEFMNMVPMASTQLMRTCSLPTETEEWRKRKELQTLRRMEARRKRYEKQRNLKSVRERNQEVVVEGISQSECQPDQGTTSQDARSPVGANSLLESEHKLPVTSGTRIAETMRNQCDKVISCANRTKDTGRNMLDDMPCVSTKGEGPNGKRIEGFLYRYRKGEEVRILCVCHGNFLTPAEFVKHAGGGDVAHPLKHIVVNPSLF